MFRTLARVSPVIALLVGSACGGPTAPQSIDPDNFLELVVDGQTVTVTGIAQSGGPFYGDTTRIGSVSITGSNCRDPHQHVDVTVGDAINPLSAKTYSTGNAYFTPNELIGPGSQTGWSTVDRDPWTLAGTGFPIGMGAITFTSVSPDRVSGSFWFDLGPLSGDAVGRKGIQGTFNLPVRPWQSIHPCSRT